MDVVDNNEDSWLDSVLSLVESDVHASYAIYNANVFRVRSKLRPSSCLKMDYLSHGLKIPADQ